MLSSQIFVDTISNLNDGNFLVFVFVFVIVVVMLNKSRSRQTRFDAKAMTTIRMFDWRMHMYTYRCIIDARSFFLRWIIIEIDNEQG